MKILAALVFLIILSPLLVLGNAHTLKKEVIILFIIFSFGKWLDFKT